MKKEIVPQLWVCVFQMLITSFLAKSRYCILGLLHCNALKYVILASIMYFEWLHRNKTWFMLRKMQYIITPLHSTTVRKIFV